MDEEDLIAGDDLDYEEYDLNEDEENALLDEQQLEAPEALSYNEEQGEGEANEYEEDEEGIEEQYSEEKLLPHQVYPEEHYQEEQTEHINVNEQMEAEHKSTDIEEEEEEETESRGDRFKSEREENSSSVVSLRRSGTTLRDIPDSLDQVVTANVPNEGMFNKRRGGMNRGRGRGGMRGNPVNRMRMPMNMGMMPPRCMGPGGVGPNFTSFSSPINMAGHIPLVQQTPLGMMSQMPRPGVMQSPVHPIMRGPMNNIAAYLRGPAPRMGQPPFGGRPGMMVPPQRLPQMRPQSFNSPRKPSLHDRLTRPALKVVTTVNTNVTATPSPSLKRQASDGGDNAQKIPKIAKDCEVSKASVHSRLSNIKTVTSSQPPNPEEDYNTQLERQKKLREQILAKKAAKRTAVQSHLASSAQAPASTAQFTPSTAQATAGKNAPVAGSNQKPRLAFSGTQATTKALDTQKIGTVIQSRLGTQSGANKFSVSQRLGLGAMSIGPETPSGPPRGPFNGRSGVTGATGFSGHNNQNNSSPFKLNNQQQMNRPPPGNAGNRQMGNRPLMGSRPPMTNRPPMTSRPPMSSRPPMGNRPLMTNRPPMGDRSLMTNRPPMGDRPLMTNRPPMGNRPLMTNRPPMGDRPLMTNRPPMGNRSLMGNRPPPMNSGPPMGNRIEATNNRMMNNDNWSSVDNRPNNRPSPVFRREPPPTNSSFSKPPPVFVSPPPTFAAPPPVVESYDNGNSQYGYSDACDNPGYYEDASSNYTLGNNDYANGSSYTTPSFSSKQTNYEDYPENQTTYGNQYGEGSSGVVSAQTHEYSNSDLRDSLNTAPPYRQPQESRAIASHTPLKDYINYSTPAKQITDLYYSPHAGKPPSQNTPSNVVFQPTFSQNAQRSYLPATTIVTREQVQPKKQRFKKVTRKSTTGEIIFIKKIPLDENGTAVGEAIIEYCKEEPPASSFSTSAPRQVVSQPFYPEETQQPNKRTITRTVVRTMVSPRL